jgi:hypothetical protein
MRHKLLSAILVTCGFVYYPAETNAQVQFDPDGAAVQSGALTVRGIRLAPGNALFDDLTSAAEVVGGTAFQYRHQASIAALIDAEGDLVVPLGLNDSVGYELTYVCNSTMRISAVSANEVKYEVANSQASNSFSEIWFDPTPDADALAGTGYNDGVLIYSAAPNTSIASAGVLSPSPRVTGPFELYDQFGSDQYAGFETVPFSGSSEHGYLTLAQDTSFFISAISQHLQTTNPAAPFTTTDPSQLFAALPNGQAPTVVPFLWRFNGDPLATDVQVMATAELLFEPAISSPAGDYNNDGTVNAADYTVWRNTLGQSVAIGTGADGTGPGGAPDGMVTQLDYDFWKANYGPPQGVAGAHAAQHLGTSVPEPAGLVLVAIGAFWSCVGFRIDRD